MVEAATAEKTEKKKPSGLEDAVVGNTSISTIIEKEATLIYGGYTIEDLAANASFEEVIHLIWYGKLPNQVELAELNSKLVANRPAPEGVLAMLRNLPQHGNSMDVLRTAVSALALYDEEAQEMSHEANLRKAIRITAQIPTLVAAYERLGQGQEPIAPSSHLSHASNFLYMLEGEEPNALRAETIDTALILHADHELNASAFATIVTASTLSDLHSAIVTAIGTLKGPLHGGANQAVMKTLEQIDAASLDAGAWTAEQFANKKLVMGFGHRVYKHGDPRAFILKKLAEQLGQQNGESKWYDMSAAIEQAVLEIRGLYPNVDFYSASTYRALGIKTSLYIPLFVISRVVGWIGHAFEQYADNRIIRPRAEYVGPEGLKYGPISNRK